MLDLEICFISKLKLASFQLFLINTIIWSEVCIQRLTTELDGDNWSVACAPTTRGQFSGC